MVILDPLYSTQWHFSLLGNIETIWDDYTGNGIRVGVYDNGVEASHEDLAANYSETLEFSGDDGLPNTPGDAHGTSVAGIIGAARNGLGGVGVAFDVTLSSVDFLNDVQNQSSSVVTAAFNHAATAFDIISNSWGSTPSYSDNLDIGDAFTGAENLANSFRYISVNGRNGLGTLATLAAGNEAHNTTLINNYGIYGNAQGDGVNNLFETVTVAATTASGYVASYSNFGANILVAAPAAAVTTDRAGLAGYDAGEYTNSFGGTSAATPVVSGVIALMLEAAPGLGWRDVQNILAISAAHTGSAFGAAKGPYEAEAWYTNGAGNWNGGGMSFNQSYGYGMVDAFAAVRMAEVWQIMNPAANTSANTTTVTAGYTGTPLAISDMNTTRLSLNVAENVNIEHVYATINLSHAYLGDLSIVLISPDGTRTQLLNREGGSTNYNDDWTFGLANLRGETSAGDWTLEIRDNAIGDTGSLIDFDLEIIGSTPSADSQWNFTDDFLLYATNQTARQIINDQDGGTDWLNFAAVTGDVALSMANGGDVNVGGVHWATFGSGNIENLILGDGNDTATGNALNNVLYGRRGNDALNGSAGDDTLYGGANNDSLVGGSGGDTLVGGMNDDLLNGEYLRADFDIIGSMVFRLYQATLDRGPDQVGHYNWTARLTNQTMTQEEVAAGFVNSAEFQSIYGTTTNSEFVTLLYNNVLHRAPDATGLSNWTGRLDDQSYSREQVVLGFSNSPEFVSNTAGSSLAYSWVSYQSGWADNVFRLYQATLGRAPDINGFTNWSAALANGQTEEQVVAGFVNSAEFQSIYGTTTNSEFVTLLYNNVLHRAPDATGLSNWTGRLDDQSYSREQVVLGFSNSPEFTAASMADLVAYIRGLGAHDRLIGGAGTNEMFGGWRADTFVFNATETASDVVYRLEAWDWIELQQSSFADAAAAIAALTETADGVTLTDGATTILFDQTHLTDFSQDMFIFV